MEMDPISDYTYNILSKMHLQEDLKSLNPDPKRALVDLYIDKLLSVLDRYMDRDDYDSFRELLLTTGAIVIGACVVEALTSHGFNAPLQIGVVREHAELLYNFFAARGYTSATHQPAASSDQVFSSCLDFVPTMATTDNGAYVAGGCRLKGRGRIVEIVLAKTSPFDLVLHATSTMMMNFISATDIVSLYPQLTLERRISLDTTREPNISHVYTPSYFHFKEFTVNPRISLYEPFSAVSDLTVLPRRVGDHLCLSIPLGPHQLPDLLFLGHRDMVNAHSWRLSMTQRGFEVHTDFISAPRLRQTYIVTPDIKSSIMDHFPKDWYHTHVDNSSSPVVAPSDPDALCAGMLRTTYDRLLDASSPCRSLFDTMSHGILVSHGDVGVSTSDLPTAALSFIAFNTLWDLPAVKDAKARIQLRLHRTFEDDDSLSPRVAMEIFVHLAPLQVSFHADTFDALDPEFLQDLGLVFHICADSTLS
ncbi:hypothetical protein VNI00_011834 [Paramarasmius palmivorus]|uniref:Uncharacterized protein n=1 Tax=Paramarasmius palmivorus TaxID=297713 RepID=A0AAW0CC54_9AGAR